MATNPKISRYLGNMIRENGVNMQRYLNFIALTVRENALICNSEQDRGKQLYDVNEWGQKLHRCCREDFGPMMVQLFFDDRY